ncbi:MAG: AarF/ABC1/UbiB kinase family protein [Planctomycetes bacterium]|nr:AarF/ABC1/UbiB kinase family protein [Planctomycetota bacterium]
MGGEEGLLARKTTPPPEELATDLEKLGPTFVKLGQVLSTRADMVPVQYLDALAQLQDRVGPFEFEQVEAIIREEFGQGVAKTFNTFDPTPIASASLGQVHKASLADGHEVAVKIQRPDIRAKLADDLEVLDEVAGMMEAATELAKRYEFKRIVADLRRTLMRELDYIEEARNLHTLAENLKDYDLLVIPQPVDELTTARVLTMDFIKGVKITKSETDRLAGGRGEKLAAAALDAYIKQVCVDGFFHADPHPGNVLLTPQDELALIDLGMVAHVAPPLREYLLRLLLAVGEGNGEDAADICLKIGEPKEDFDEPRMRRRIADLVASQQGVGLAQIQLGKTVLEIARTAGDSHMRVPRELTMLGKAMMSLDNLGHSLEPKFDPYGYIRRHAPALIFNQLKRGITATNVLTRALEISEFAQRLPGRVNKILDRVADNHLEIKVKSFDEQRLTEGFQKVANRIAEGLVIAAMIIAAAQLMQVPSPFAIFGYPALSVLLFVLAAVGAGVLAIDIWRHDRKKKK